MNVFVCLLLSTLSLSLYSQEDAGMAVPDIGTDAIDDVQCEADILVFFDRSVNEDRSIDCIALGGHCGILNDDWGLDCVLDENAMCDSGYANGYTRCNREAGLFCIESKCIISEPIEQEGVEPPDDASGIGDRPNDTGSCVQTDSSFLILSLIGLIGMKRRQRYACA